jgi:amino acid transporter
MAELRKALGVWDVILLNVTAIIGLRWISLAAAGGNTSMTLWVTALALFFFPQAVAVIELTRKMPAEGGVYSWTKSTFGDLHAFIAGWCYWTNNLVYFPFLLVYVAGISVFIAGSGYQDVGESRTYVLTFSLLALLAVTVANIVGLQTGKWLQNAGGVGTWGAGAVLLVFGALAFVRFGPANPMPVASFFEEILTFDKLSFLAGICFGFAGLELAAVLAGEIKDPERVVPKATLVSGAIITVVYVLGTLTLLVALPRSEINVITGFLQGIAAVGDKLGASWATRLLAILITLGGVGGLMAWFTGAARMPFVAGIDRFLPDSFGRLHPKYGSPYVAVTLQAVIAAAFAVMSFAGATVKEAYLVLLDTTLLVYFVPYVYLFATHVMVRKQDLAPEPDYRFLKSQRLAQLAGGCGLITTLLAMAMALVPPEDTDNVLLFEIKVIGGFLAFLGVGGLVYWLSTRAPRRDR